MILSPAGFELNHMMEFAAWLAYRWVMPGTRLLARTVIFCAATVALIGASLVLRVFFDDGFSNSELTGRSALRSADHTAAPFAHRFAELGNFAMRPYATGVQVDRAKTSLATGLIAQQSKIASADQTAEPNPTVAAVPMPKARPIEAQFGQNALSTPSGDQPSASTDDTIKTALQKVLAFLQPSGPQLASVAPDGGVSGDGKALQPGVFDKHTAVYDISAKTVYMPDGTRLEAHSGLGEFMDDPRHVAVKDRGPTPPNVYELKLREKRFHGVQAIRMRPVGNGELFGRSGLLTHSYLMGPNGDSNGCVSFKDYDAFLQAFVRGDIKRLVVVKSLSDEATPVPAKV
jgi:hypothetical protein